MKTGRIMRIALVCMLMTMMSMALPGGNALGAGWNAAGTLATGRTGHSATQLPNGKVLVVVGYSGLYSFILASVE